MNPRLNKNEELEALSLDLIVTFVSPMDASSLSAARHCHLPHHLHHLRRLLPRREHPHVPLPTRTVSAINPQLSWLQICFRQILFHLRQLSVH